MSRIEVTRENLVCAKCGAHGHNTGAFGCQFFGIPSPRIYNSRCSRCNQPGHNRSNSNSRWCSLYDQYPDYCYLTNDDIVVRRRPTVLREYEYVPDESPEPVRLLPSREPVVLPTRQPIVPPEPAPVVRSEVIERITNKNRITGNLISTIGRDAPNDKILNQAKQWYNLLKSIKRTDMSQLTDVELTKHETYVNSFYKLIVDYGFVRPKRNITVIKVHKKFEPSSECCVCLLNKNYSHYCELNCKHNNICTVCLSTMIIKGRRTIDVPIKCSLCRCNVTSITCFTEENARIISESL
jgi:hypothetical protein